MLLGFLHKRVLILLCSFLLVLQSSKAQIGALEDSVFIYRSATLQAKTDSSRLTNNRQAFIYLLKAVKEDGGFDYSYSKLKSFSVKTLDKKTRIITWNVALTDDSQQFFGILLRKTNDRVLCYELEDINSKNTDWEKTSTGADNWLGAIYYDIIPAGKKNTFILLGWRGKDRLISQKVLDVLYFDEDVPRFGAPIIQHGSSQKYRAIFTYPAEVPFSLQYDKEEKRIVYDRLIPIDEKFVGNYAFYSPNSIFDAYKYSKKKWVLVQDVNAMMPERIRKTPTPEPAPVSK